MKIGLNPLLRLFGYKMIKPYQDSLVYQHEYRGGYKEYKETQIFHNKRKLALVWADKKTLGLVADHLRRHNKQKTYSGLCHGARNGFEVAWFNEQLPGKTIGTDISDTANQLSEYGDLGFSR